MAITLAYYDTTTVTPKKLTVLGFFTAVIYGFSLQARVFATGKLFQPSLVFVGEARGRIFSPVRPFYDQAVSDPDRSMHISLWV